MKSWFEKAVLVFNWFSGLLLITTVALLLGYLFQRGLGGFRQDLIFGTTAPLDAILLRRQVFDGLFPAIAGTLALIFLAMGAAIPIGIGGGIYMAEYAQGRVKTILSLIFDILAAIPSIVIGLAGLALAIFLHHRFPGRIAPCLLIAALSLAFLVLPYLIRTTQNALEGVDPLIRNTAPALGASRLQNIRYVLLPAALPDIAGGVILATGRCAEDTAVIMLTGAVASAGVPKTLFGQFEALPFYIYYTASQYSGPEELTRCYSAAIVLLLICSMLFFLASLLQRRLCHFLLYR